MDDKISIIVAIYNVKPYLKKCIDSILAQSYQNLEVILVDDGSTDGSGIVCDMYQKADCRVQVIHQKNQGAAKVRKAGVQLARGKYIGFVDGDDWIEKEMYETLHRYMLQYNAEVVTSGMYRDNDKGTYTTWKGSNFPEGVYLSGDSFNPIYLNLFTDGVQNISGSVCNKLFSAELVTDIIMNIDDRIREGEDVICAFTSILFAHTVYISDRVFYHGYDRRDSTTHKRNARWFEQLNLIYLNLSDSFSRHIYSEKLLEDLDTYMYNEILGGISHFFEDKFFPCYFLGGKREEYEKKRIVLYGAGKVGRSYYQHLSLLGGCDIVLWVDQNDKLYRDKGWQVENVEKIALTEYDLVIIAIKGREAAEPIKESLVKRGIERDKIVWFRPLSPFEYFMDSHRKKDNFSYVERQ